MTFKEWTEEKVVPGSKNTAEGLDPSDLKEVKILRLSKTWWLVSLQGKKRPGKNTVLKPGEDSCVERDLEWG